MGLLDALLPHEAGQKLKIESWDKIEKSGDSTQVFTAFINPDEIALNYSVLTEQNPAAGATGNAGAFLGTSPFQVTLKFFLDGTGANGVVLDVKAKIIEFYQTTGYDGKGHRTRFLRINWPGLIWYRANQFAFDCILKTAAIQYKLFKPDGSPLRAIITATFIEKRTDAEILQENDPKSADLTHVRVVKEGDTLPGMVRDIYGDFKYYLQVAKVNRLRDFRNISPGQKLIFPPLDKTKKQ
ncbi:hypothetical protein ADIARSV_2350 [Arcticibacter svalbardensis MN12-7]|uniref:LysM domain-containing protein n=1 Tax=Arcticibacter svalbardensis MN12-7 TaxID=1150600 RepID=R9GZT9_9SPHI|nr:hypothetical protein [Arcticibacter svalbardensis]EOR94504.1 hypothetical protein ADIARSV_2350 [Arcticibacter svalbardensis MN12-7]